MASISTSAIAQLCSITGLDDATASFYLESAGGNIESAIEIFFAQQSHTNNTISSTTAAATTTSSSSNNSNDTTYNMEQIATSPLNCYKIVEADPFGQYPFIYVIEGSSTILVLDTGCGVSNLRHFLDTTINKSNKPYLVILSHVHFDHIGGAYSFCKNNGTELGDGVIDIVMSNASIKFSQNVDLCSLCTSHGTTIKPFYVSNWVQDQTRFWLSDDVSNLDHAIDLLHTPGHSSDSICLYSFGLNRLFVADSIYPYTAMDHSSIGHNVVDYAQSMKRLKTYLCQDVPKIRQTGTSSSSVSSVSSVSSGGATKVDLDNDYKSATNSDATTSSSSNDGKTTFGLLQQAMTSELLIETFQNLMQLSANELNAMVGTKKQFVSIVKKHKNALDSSIWTREVAQSFKSAMQVFPLQIPLTPMSHKTAQLMSATGKRKAESAPTIDLTSSSGSSSSSSNNKSFTIDLTTTTTTTTTTATTTLSNCGTMISCGHVEENLTADSIDDLLTMLTFIQLGALQPSKIDDGVGEYNSGKFHLIMTCDCVQKLNSIKE